MSARRWLSTRALERRLAEPVQSYISTSTDPYLNLSVEHYILQKSAPETAILFLYVNRPSIIIGRNQNPWLEVNLALLNHSKDRPETEPPGLGVVNLVRRRSGGGTVFHDEGNVNWTVICPSVDFTRDKHAEMVVRALRECGIERARVNERHDIVLDQEKHKKESDPADMHRTAYTNPTGNGLRPLKVSGSAYKLTRNRALHHGTCLLSSPNLNVIPHYLHSPAKPFIKARGVESVSSPVSNVLLENKDFIGAVQHHFARQYNAPTELASEILDEELLASGPVSYGFEELKSLDWTYLQTPQFTISNGADEAAAVNFELTVRHGVVTESALHPRREETADTSSRIEGLRGKKLHEVTSWAETLEDVSLSASEKAYLAKWLQNHVPADRGK